MIAMGDGVMNHVRQLASLIVSSSHNDIVKAGPPLINGLHTLFC